MLEYQCYAERMSDPDPDFLRLMEELKGELRGPSFVGPKYSPLEEVFREVPQSIANRLERNTDTLGTMTAARHQALPAIIELSVRISAATWQTILFISAGKEIEGWRPAFLTSVPPLTRSILDVLFLLVYLFDNAESNTRKFFVAGWGKGMTRHATMLARHGQEPGQEKWLRGLMGATKDLERFMTLTEQERRDPKQAGWWPVPSRMRFVDPRRKAFVDLLDNLFYGDLSDESHLSFPGLATRSSLLSSDNPIVSVPRYRTTVLLPGLLVFLSLLSEVAADLRLAREKQRVREVWQVFLAKPGWYEPMVLHKERYEELLRET